MSEISITVTEASRNFADCVNRVHYQGQAFLLLKNGLPFARLLPVEDKRCTGRDLAAVIVGSRLTTAESKAWRRDLGLARKGLKRQPDKWE